MMNCYQWTLLLLLTVNCFCIFPCFSQSTDPLARKGSLGVRLEALTAERIAETALKQAGGVYISQVLPGSTGEAIGLENGDILLDVAGQSISTVQEVVQQTREWRAGQSLEVKVWRNGKPIVLGGTIQGKPVETSAEADVIYGSVRFRGGRLRSIMYKPKADGRLPLVVYLQGFDCGSIDDYYFPDSPIRQLVDGLVERGFAVFRVEKPGVGDSSGSLRCEDIGYDTEVAAFDAALQQLDTYDFIDQGNIFYFGHSLGGVTAPLLAARHEARGVAVYGTVFESWYEYMQKVFRDQAYRRGDDWISTETASREAQEFLARLFALRESPMDMAKDPGMQRLLENRILDFDGDSRFVGRHYTFWQELNAANPVHAWRDAGVHALAIYGEHDLHAIGPGDARRIAELVEYYHPGKGKFALLPGTEHAFAKVPSMEEYVRMRRDGSFNSRYMAANFNPELVRLLADWMDGIMRSDQKKVGQN